MADRDTLSRATAENVLILLCFEDAHALALATFVESQHFESVVYQKIAERVLDFIGTYKVAPKEHLADILEDLLEDKDQKKAELFSRTVEMLYATRGTVNSTYAISQAQKFVRHQTLRAALTNAVASVRNNQYDEAEAILTNSLNASVTTFQRGLQLSSPDALSFLDQADHSIPIGIGPLDDLLIRPAPGELLIFLALPNRGKTWFLIQCGKTAALARKKVLHISLEMSEPKMMSRYVQSLFSIAKRRMEKDDARLAVMNFLKGEHGYLETMLQEKLEHRPSMQDTDVRELLNKKIALFRGKNLIEIKRFPTGSLTSRQLEAYLDGLERHYNWIPDVVLVDYADLMYMDSSRIRTETMQIYKDLRGLAVARNFACVTASQSNRAGEGEKTLTLKNLAEDFSKAGIADTILSYNQTPEEKLLGLARIFVAKARDEATSQSVLISQNYSIGQFCLDAALMHENSYWKELDAIGDEHDS